MVFLQKLNEILASLQSATASDSIDHRGTEIVEAIKRMKEQRWQTTAEEMRAILEERDMAFAKVGSFLSNSLCMNDSNSLSADKHLHIKQAAEKFRPFTVFVVL